MHRWSVDSWPNWWTLAGTVPWGDRTVRRAGIRWPHLFKCAVVKLNASTRMIGTLEGTIANDSNLVNKWGFAYYIIVMCGNNNLVNRQYTEGLKLFILNFIGNTSILTVFRKMKWNGKRLENKRFGEFFVGKSIWWDITI